MHCRTAPYIVMSQLQVLSPGRTAESACACTRVSWKKSQCDHPHPHPTDLTMLCSTPVSAMVRFCIRPLLTSGNITYSDPRVHYHIWYTRKQCQPRGKLIFQDIVTHREIIFQLAGYISVCFINASRPNFGK